MRDCQNKEGKIDLAKIGTNRDKTFLRIHTTVIRVMASSLRSLEFSLSHFKKIQHQPGVGGTPCIYSIALILELGRQTSSPYTETLLGF